MLPALVRTCSGACFGANSYLGEGTPPCPGVPGSATLHRILEAAEQMQWTLAAACPSLTLEDGPPGSPPANTCVSLGEQPQMEHGGGMSGPHLWAVAGSWQGPFPHGPVQASRQGGLITPAHGGSTARGFPCPPSLAPGLWHFQPRRGPSGP